MPGEQHGDHATQMRVLCKAAEIVEGEARGFPAAPGGFTGLFAVRRNGALHVAGRRAAE